LNDKKLNIDRTYLITGAAGFIGYFLTKRLLEQGCRVIGIDNINDYYDVNLKYYVNGGFFGGFIYMFIIGIIIGKLLSRYRDRSDIEQNPIGAFVSIAVLNIVSGFPRSAVYLVIKEFVYGVLIILLMVWLFRQIRHRRSTQNVA
jgi:uncharacterized membrane protein